MPYEPRARAIIEKYNPRNFVNHWSTPQLIIHGSKDFRLPETEGIGAFHALKECVTVNGSTPVVTVADTLSPFFTGEMFLLVL